MISDDAAPQTEASRPPAKRFAGIRETLAKRPDSEHEMTANRLVFATAVLMYLKIATFTGSTYAGEILSVVWPVFALYYAVSFLLFAHIVKYPASSPGRRVFAIFHDLGMISFTAAACGMAGGFMYPLFLWTIFGNGFRFGVKYLYIATSVSLLGFAGVIWHTGIATTSLGLTVSLVVGLIILPLYVSVLIRKLSFAKQQAEEANRAKSLFLASVSHELRTPLNAIIGLGGILRQRPREREEAEMVRTIERSGQSLLSLINSILNLSRIEAGRMPMQSTRFDLFALVADVRSMLSVQAKEKGLRLSTHISARTPQYVTASKMNIEEILINLTANAVKFTKSGYVLVSVDCVESDDGAARLLIDVIDTGVGIEQVAQKRIFESFTQADETVINEFGGSGLGLAICKQLVESQGGKIGVESTKGEGSRFWLEFPITADAALEASAESTDQQRPARRVILATQDQALAADVVAASPAALCVSDNHAAWLLLQGLAGIEEDVFVLVDERLDQAADLPTRLIGPDYDGLRFLLLRAATEEPLSHDLQQRFHSASARDLDAVSLERAFAAASSHGNREDERSAGSDERRLDGVSVLVAEDNKTNQMVITKILESVGCRVLAVDDGEKALEAMAQEAFDVVLMDLNMPNMDGIEAAKLYAFTSLGERRVPIIALTADATEETRKRCLDAGMIGFATKPIETRELLDIICEAVAGEAAAGEGVEKQRHAPPARPALDLSKSRIINLDTLRQLEKLGGPGFVSEIVEQCARDVDQLCTELADCVAQLDRAGFDDCLHALRSCAANAGAERVFALCLAWRNVNADELTERGDQLIENLRAEISSFRIAYARHAAGAGAVETAAPPARLSQGG
jgi:two-component system, sensor histidine kinase RpfC